MKEENKYKSIFSAKPHYLIEADSFVITNFGSEYFFPKKSLTEGLKEIIIFTEGNTKYDIPNGSVWVYDANQDYNPEILKEDVGCGITGFLTDNINISEDLGNDIVKIIREENIKIGRGNHFISINESHPSLDHGNMLFIHSDFNLENILPIKYETAEELQKEAKEKRIETGYKLLNRLGISGELYKNWTHNSIDTKNDLMIYRKGAINTSETEYEGIVASNPFDGIRFYVSKWKKHYNSMQHSLGVRNLEKADMSKIKKIKDDKIEVHFINQNERPQNLYKHYKERSEFNKQFSLESLHLGTSRPLINIYTG